MGEDITAGSSAAPKTLVRKEMLAKRRALDESDRAKRSAKICESFLNSGEYAKASSILLYKAYNNEVDTDMIFKKAVADGKTVAYPISRITDGEPELTFYVITDHDQLTKGYKGIPEPDPQKAGGVVCGSADVCITPMVAFSKSCQRIGYGKAFYDRYIRLNTPKSVIGVAYDIQMADGWASEESDRAVDMVITDTMVYIK
ncbi:MAG: 5-formyltetrahydrofolate cyclo-ligase [Lachnospiraceae bacterium]|nr:5-formyltetrahydrofolate cyclo-ligase [Lachnospiraceae bacterium]